MEGVIGVAAGWMTLGGAVLAGIGFLVMTAVVTMGFLAAAKSMDADVQTERRIVARGFAWGVAAGFLGMIGAVLFFEVVI